MSTIPSFRYQLLDDASPSDHPTDLDDATTGSQTRDAPKGSLERAKATGRLLIHHIVKHTGVGIVCSVAYFDPGNWGVDLQAGSQFGYKLLFVVLLAGLFAVFLQVLAARLGCVTGVDLASHCRLLLHSRPKHTLWYRWLGLYPLYVLSEVAIVATDLAELLGSAIGLCLLFPKLQLWHGVLITAGDVIFILALNDPLRGRPVRMFEVLIGVLVLAVLVCMVVIISRIEVNWGQAFDGFIPSKYIFAPGALYTSVGILGATVMPHSLFLGSTLATQDRVSSAWKSRYPPSESSRSSSQVTILGPRPRRQRAIQAIKEYLSTPFRTPPPNTFPTRAQRYEDRENNSFEFISAHIYHGMVDMMLSLLGFAVMINALILVLASAVFYYGTGVTASRGSGGSGGPASLFDAYDLVKELVGQGAATLFAIALLAAGQSSSLIATVAGQAVSEGFLNWRVSPALRRILTRLLAVIPSMTVAILMGRPGIDTLLVASQVVLSVTLPFVTFPLIYCTSSKAIMSVRKPRTVDSLSDESVVEEADDEMINFSSGWVMTGIGAVIWLIVVAANAYMLISLMIGG